MDTHILFENAVPKSVCDIILSEETVGQEFHKGTIRDGEVVEHRRVTDVTFLDNKPWVTGLMTHHMNGANVIADWKYNLHQQNYSCQLGYYSKGSFYKWHGDVTGDLGIYEGPRVLSSVLMLSEPNEYDGGELLLETRSVNEDNTIAFDTFKMNKGDILVFPSYLNHQVCEVLSGIRKTLVCWMHEKGK